MTADISKLREVMMSNRKVICTGNPNDPSNLAHGIRKIFPEATFIHKSAGWDLTDTSFESQEKLKNVFKNHNTFINASFIAPYVQSRLLDLCQQSVKFCDVFNIGSTHEYDGLGNPEYQKSKLDLRNKSLSLNTFRFKTHHVIVGGINKFDSPQTKDWLAIDTICSIIPWIISQDFEVPIICIDQPKQPW